MTEQWCQCRMQHGDEERVIWIPAMYAECGNILHDEDSGLAWKITEAYRNEIIDHRPDVHGAGKRHKRRTGDL